MGIIWRVISGEGEGKNQGKGAKNKKHIDRHKIDGERLRMVQETEKPKNLHV